MHSNTVQCNGIRCLPIVYTMAYKSAGRALADLLALAGQEELWVAPKSLRRLPLKEDIDIGVKEWI